MMTRFSPSWSAAQAPRAAVSMAFPLMWASSKWSRKPSAGTCVSKEHYYFSVKIPILGIHYKNISYDNVNPKAQGTRWTKVLRVKLLISFLNIYLISFVLMIMESMCLLHLQDVEPMATLSATLLTSPHINHSMRIS